MMKVIYFDEFKSELETIYNAPWVPPVGTLVALSKSPGQWKVAEVIWYADTNLAIVNLVVNA